MDFISSLSGKQGSLVTLSQVIPLKSKPVALEKLRKLLFFLFFFFISNAQDYQAEIEAFHRRNAQAHIVDWVEKEVVKSISPQLVCMEN